MLTISRPLSSGQAQNYHSQEFSNSRDNYYSQDEKIRGEWHGRLATQWGLEGEVTGEQFARLSEGRHPVTDQQVVRFRAPLVYTNEHGATVRTMEHRAGWDATFSAPKPVSLTALVAGDEQVRNAHRESVDIALNELEKYVQARVSSHDVETTGKWAAAKFEHDSSRPVDGYAAPQLHTHVVFFNVTECGNGETRSLQPRELYRSQQYATAVYRSELALRLKALGYEVERGASGQPEIKGYSPEYIEASSPRRREIRQHLEEKGIFGAEAAQIAAHRTRGKKLDISHEEMQRMHLRMAEQYGNQARQTLQTAKARRDQIQNRAEHYGQEPPELSRAAVEAAITFARNRNIEREAVVNERELMRDALKHSMGEAPLAQIQKQFAERIERGGLIEVEQKYGAPDRAFTTPEMIRLERENLRLMLQGQEQHPALASLGTRRRMEQSFERLSDNQRAAALEIMSSRDQITGLDGEAGSGKTTALRAIREAAEMEGYRVEGFAPTSRAAQKLAEAGMEVSTLQHHLARGVQTGDQARHFYILDESSLAGTRQVNEFLRRLNEYDRVLLVGDVRQHQSVEAGKPYEQLQQAGLRTAHLTDIVRQKDVALKEAVQQLSRGDVRSAIASLQKQERVHEIPEREERLNRIAQDYALKPERTLVVSPDNESRRELNAMIRRDMQERGHISLEERTFRVLEPRQELTGADRAWAGQYQTGDVLRYSKGSSQYRMEAGSYATVRNAATGREENLITVVRKDGTELTYDPRRLSGVAVYRESERQFAEGDRIQFTAPSRELHVANRELGTIAGIEENGNIAVRTDSGRNLRFAVEEHPHLDHGYAVTSHSSQGQTAERVLIHVDTQQSEKLVNSRMAYVSVSRGSHEVEIYTDNGLNLARRLGRDISQRSATSQNHEQQHERGESFKSSQSSHQQERGHDIAHQSQESARHHGEGHTSEHGHGESASAGQGHGHGHGHGEGAGQGFGE